LYPLSTWNLAITCRFVLNIDHCWFGNYRDKIASASKIYLIIKSLLSPL